MKTRCSKLSLQLLTTVLIGTMVFAFSACGGGGTTEGINSPAVVAKFNKPRGVAVDAAGNVYVADTDNSTIRKITIAGVVTTLAGTAGIVGSADGTGAAARFDHPRTLAIDTMGNVYVADTVNSAIRKITPGGVVTTLAGTAKLAGMADGTGPAARFNYPWGIAVASTGNIYVADTDNYAIRKITPGGVVTTLAGGAIKGGYRPDDGIGAAATFDGPSGVAVDSAENIYVADKDGGTIRKITSAGAVTTIARSSLYGWSVGSPVGPGTQAVFGSPIDLGVDSSGNLYVADEVLSSIIKITPAGVVTTFAGSGTRTGFGWADGIGASATFNSSNGVAVNGAGNIYVADTANSTIRKITPAGLVTTLAGTPGADGSIDGSAHF